MLLDIVRGRLVALVAASTVSTAACAISEQSTRLGPDPDPVTVRLRPDLPRTGQPAEVTVESAGADSVMLKSADGLDRFSARGPKLVAMVGGDFAAGKDAPRYAVRHGKQLLDQLERPIQVTSCRDGVCRDYDHILPVRLPEKNGRTVELTAGYSTIFARRSILGGGRTVLLREALSSGFWTVNGEWAAPSWNVHAMGFWSDDEHLVREASSFVEDLIAFSEPVGSTHPGPEPNLLSVDFDDEAMAEAASEHWLDHLADEEDDD